MFSFILSLFTIYNQRNIHLVFIIHDFGACFFGVFATLIYTYIDNCFLFFKPFLINISILASGRKLFRESE